MEGNYAELSHDAKSTTPAPAYWNRTSSGNSLAYRRLRVLWVTPASGQPTRIFTRNTVPSGIHRWQWGLSCRPGTTGTS